MVDLPDDLDPGHAQQGAAGEPEDQGRDGGAGHRSHDATALDGRLCEPLRHSEVVAVGNTGGLVVLRVSARAVAGGTSRPPWPRTSTELTTSISMTIETHRKLRWGVLGYARIGREVVMPAIQRAQNSQLLALGSRDETKRRAAKEKY